jgi:hypothetical protein
VNQKAQASLRAKVQLMEALFYGEGVRRSYKKAFLVAAEAAQAGAPRAQLYLGFPSARSAERKRFGKRCRPAIITNFGSRGFDFGRPIAQSFC